MRSNKNGGVGGTSPIKLWVNEKFAPVRNRFQNQFFPIKGAEKAKNRPSMTFVLLSMLCPLLQTPPFSAIGWTSSFAGSIYDCAVHSKQNEDVGEPSQ